MRKWQRSDAQTVADCSHGLGTPPIVYDLPEAANSVWSEGSLLIINPNGEAELNTGDDQATFWGIAENAGQNGPTNEPASTVLRLIWRVSPMKSERQPQTWFGRRRSWADGTDL